MELAGKVALVTGGARGIGEEYCQALVKNGAKVVICDLLEDEGKKLEAKFNQKEKKALYLACDITNDTQLEECFKRALSEFGQLDIVINNAGFINESKAGWKRMVEVNLIATISGSLIALKYLRKGGAIVMTSSLAGVHRDSIFPIYSATKGGVNYFVRSLGSPKGFEQTGIRIMAIAPSLTDTAMTNQNYGKIALFPGVVEKIMTLRKHIPSQKSEAVANCLIHILRENVPSGSVWLVENGTWREIDYTQLYTY